MTLDLGDLIWWHAHPLGQIGDGDAGYDPPVGQIQAREVLAAEFSGVGISSNSERLRRITDLVAE
jgi:hypothetical protein